MQKQQCFVGSKFFSLLIIPIDLETLFSIDFLWNAKLRLGSNNLPKYLQQLPISTLF